MFKNLSPGAIGISGHQSEIIELALSYGFSGIELNAAEFAARVRLKGLPYARRLIDSAKIRVGLFPLPVDLDTDEEQFQRELGKLPEIAQAAAEVGCTRAVALLRPATDSRPYHENFELHRRRISEVCGALAPAGARLGIGFQAAEPLRRNRAYQFIHDFDSLMLLLNMVGAANLGLVLDSWDLTIAGVKLAAIGKLALQQVVAIYLSELPAEPTLAELDDTSRLLPGDERGRGVVAPLLGTLAALGYDGPVTPKAHRNAFSSRKREVIARQAGEAMEKVWRAAGLPSDSRRPFVGVKV